MAGILTIGILAAGLVLCWLRGKNEWLRTVVDGAGAVCFLCLFVIVAKSVLMTLAHGTVYLTEVHGILRKPLLLLCGAYMGPYVFALILGAVWSSGRQSARH